MMNNTVESIWASERDHVRGFNHPVSVLLRENAANLENDRQDIAGDFIAKTAALASAMPYSVNEKYLKRFFKIFIPALHGKHIEAGNIYRDNEMLEAFNAFYHSAPFVRFGHAAANRFITEQARDTTDITIIDIGCGNGLQWQEMFHETSKKITLIGIDLPTSRNRAAFDAFAEQARSSNIVFKPILSEVEAVDFNSLAAHCGFIAVNASFALHHILPDELDVPLGRQQLLEKIRAIAPDLFILVEPDSNHNTLAPAPTIIESMAHYMTIFHALDNVMPETGSLGVIENAFFGREMHNILCNHDASRYERHERFEQWASRLIRLGFHQVDKRVYSWEKKSLLVASAWTCGGTPAMSRH
jgi:SAM-dependent methyltransferase